MQEITFEYSDEFYLDRPRFEVWYKRISQWLRDPRVQDGQYLVVVKGMDVYANGLCYIVVCVTAMIYGNWPIESGRFLKFSMAFDDAAVKIIGSNTKSQLRSGFNAQMDQFEKEQVNDGKVRQAGTV